MSILATVSPSQNALSLAAYLRVASISIAAYDYLLTLPAEYRLYKSSDRRSPALVLFVLIRYISMTAIIATNVGFFHHGFTQKSCSHFYDVAPALKAIQMMVSQAILGFRTYNVTHRNVWVARTLVSAYIITVPFEWFGAVGYRIPQMTNGTCSVASLHPLWPVSTWSFYLAAMLYDCLALSISTYYLLKLRLAEVSVGSGLVTILLYDGLIYFVALTAVNVMNIVFYRSTNRAIQSAGCSLGKALTWIMSQRIIIHVREANRARQTSAVIAQPPSWPLISPASHVSGETGRERGFSRDQTMSSPYPSVNAPSDYNIQVCVQESVFVDAKLADEGSIEGGIYASPRSTWDRGHAM